MASISDIFSAVQNVVSGISTLGNTYLQVNGLSRSYGLTTTTVVKSSAGRLARVSVIVAGSGVGTAYDASSTTVTTAPIYVIPMTVGIVEVNMPFQSGLVIAPGSGQTVSVSYA